VLSYSDHIKQQLLVKVYFKNDRTPRQINAIGRRFDPKVNPLVHKLTFVSKEEALRIMQKRLPELNKGSPTTLPGFVRDSSDERRVHQRHPRAVTSDPGRRRSDQRRRHDVAQGLEGRRHHLRRLPDRRAPPLIASTC
jgi:hypothetical protein